MPTSVDTIISARWVIPVEPFGTILEQHAVVIQHGRILAILPATQARQQFVANETIELDDHALMPGLINSHTHASMNLLRGIADDLPLMDWLNHHIWPAEQKWVGEKFIADGTRLAIAEMIKSGTTCFNDMYFFPNISAQVAAAVGMRAMLGMIVIDFPSAWAQDTNAYFSKGLELHDQYRDHPLVSTALAPHAPYSVCDEAFKRVQMIANELDCQVHVHVHESADEINMSLEQYKMRPLERLNKLGLLSPAMVAVHMTQLNQAEIELIAESGVNVVHCPQSNLKLASGFSPVTELMAAGVNVALGTDSSASNNNLDMLEEMQWAAQLAKGVSNNPSSLPAYQALQMATINGAKALGLESETGSLLAGKAADIIAINLHQLNTMPVYNPVSQIVYAANSRQISDVWIAGKRQLRQGQLVNFDEAELLMLAQDWAERIRS